MSALPKLKIESLEVQDLREDALKTDSDYPKGESLGLVQVSVIATLNGMDEISLCFQNENDHVLCLNNASGDDSYKLYDLFLGSLSYDELEENIIGLAEIREAAQKAFDEYLDSHE